MRKPKVHAAAERGDVSELRRILDTGIRPDVIWRDGVTPIQLACSEGHTNAVSLLIEAGASLETKGPYFNETCLHMAALGGHTESVQLLLTMGLEVNARDRRGQTPLHYAAAGYEGTLTTAELLLERGASADAVDEEGETPLCIAAITQNLGVVYLLVKSGASKSHRDLTGKSAFALALMQVANYKKPNGDVVPGNLYAMSVVTDILRLTKE